MIVLTDKSTTATLAMARPRVTLLTFDSRRLPATVREASRIALAVHDAPPQT